MAGSSSAGIGASTWHAQGRVVAATAVVLVAVCGWVGPARSAVPTTFITVNGDGGARMLDGVGAVLGGGGNARYPWTGGVQPRHLAPAIPDRLRRHHHRPPRRPAPGLTHRYHPHQRHTRHHHRRLVPAYYSHLAITSPLGLRSQHRRNLNKMSAWPHSVRAIGAKGRHFTISAHRDHVAEGEDQVGGNTR